MDYLTDNTRIIERHDLITPIELIEKYPISNESLKFFINLSKKMTDF